jgi:HTH-type transcriptional regulator/antitoxin HipB
VTVRPAAMPAFRPLKTYRFGTMGRPAVTARSAQAEAVVDVLVSKDQGPDECRGPPLPEQQIMQAMAEPTLIDTPAALGFAVLTARRRLGLSQPKLALAAGVSLRFIVDLESGKPTLRLEHILRVLHSLGASLAVHGLPELGRV